MERQFAHAGGLLIAGTDPTGGGGVIPGYSDQRQVELLVESGFTPLEAIRICSLNGATYLGKASRIGSIVLPEPRSSRKRVNCRQDEKPCCRA